MVIYPKSEKKKTPVFKEKLRSFNVIIVSRGEILSKKEIQNSKFKNKRVCPSLVGNPIARIIFGHHIPPGETIFKNIIQGFQLCQEDYETLSNDNVEGPCSWLPSNHKDHFQTSLDYISIMSCMKFIISAQTWLSIETILRHNNFHEPYFLKMKKFILLNYHHLLEKNVNKMHPLNVIRKVDCAISWSMAKFCQNEK